MCRSKDRFTLGVAFLQNKLMKVKENERLAINVTVSQEDYEFVRLQAYLKKTSMSGYVKQLIDSERKRTGGRGLLFK